jgi:hypothetical protein
VNAVVGGHPVVVDGVFDLGAMSKRRAGLTVVT